MVGGVRGGELRVQPQGWLQMFTSKYLQTSLTLLFTKGEDIGFANHAKVLAWQQNEYLMTKTHLYYRIMSLMGHY